jgi:small subunit ribosomal protein S2
MKRFILTERNGIYIIDLGKTLGHIDSAFAFIKQTVARGGSVLFIGTKKQAQEAVQEQAIRVGMPYVNQRWLGGMLTNFQTISLRLQRLKELEEMNLEESAGSAFTKKERLMMSRERDKLARTLGGIRTMSKLPAAVWIVDTKKEHLAVDEARKLGIPVVAILDTNADPDEVDYAVPGNDDAIRAVGLLTRVVADAVAEGLVERHSIKETTGDESEPPAEPLAEWEQELLAVAETPVEAPVKAAAPVADAAAAAPAEAAAPVEAAAPAADVAPAAPAEVPAPVEAAPADTAAKAEETSAPAEAVPAEAPKKAAAPKPAAKAEAKAEEPKAEEPKAEKKKAEPKAEEPKAEEPKAEKKKAEPKAEEPKAEEPKKPAPKAEAKAEEPKAEKKKAEPKVEEPKAEEPKKPEPKAEPKAEEPKAEEPKQPAAKAKAEEPKAEEPKAEEPKAAESKADEPKATAAEQA